MATDDRTENDAVLDARKRDREDEAADRQAHAAAVWRMRAQNMCDHVRDFRGDLDDAPRTCPMFRSVGMRICVDCCPVCA